MGVDKINFRFLARVQRGRMGFVLIRINRTVVYSCRIECRQTQLNFLTRFGTIRSSIRYELLPFALIQ
jgi:hypothetical protein